MVSSTSSITLSVVRVLQALVFLFESWQFVIVFVVILGRTFGTSVGLQAWRMALGCLRALINGVPGTLSRRKRGGPWKKRNAKCPERPVQGQQTPGRTAQAQRKEQFIGASSRQAASPLDASTSPALSGRSVRNGLIPEGCNRRAVWSRDRIQRLALFTRDARDRLLAVRVRRNLSTATVGRGSPSTRPRSSVSPPA